MPDGGRPPADAYDQAVRCFEIIATALAEHGASAADVVRTRMYLSNGEDWEDVGRAHGETFGEVRPASTMVLVTGFVDPSFLVEIEADALLPE
jgi:enamine deaminase RidA (YjgF/YER057c/UK114 family)